MGFENVSMNGAFKNPQVGQAGFSQKSGPSGNRLFMKDVFKKKNLTSRANIKKTSCICSECVLGCETPPVVRH